MKEKKSKLLAHKFIVFAYEGFNTLGVIRALGEAGIRPYLVLWDKAELSLYSKYVQETYLSYTLENGIQYILSRFGNETEKPFIFATSDETVSCLDLHYDELKDKFYFYNAGEQGRLTKLMEKGYLPKLAESCGLRIPRTEEVRNGELPTTLSYPVITKSPTSTISDWKSNVHICNNDEELLHAFKQINQERVVIQEYIEKVNEINYEGFVINDGKDLYMPLDNRFYRTEKDSYGEYAYIERNCCPDLIEPIKNLFKRTGYNGVFEIEFLVDKNGKTYFLEINFRSSAWLYAYNKAGVNLPYMFALSTLQNRLDVEPEKIKKLPFSFMYPITDFKLSVSTGKVSFWRWIQEFLSADCFFYYNRHDMKPFWAKMRSYIRDILISSVFFSECFDTLVLACDNPFDLRDCKEIKRINSSRNILAFSPVTITADPFLVVKDDILYLFYEEYRYRDKGIIKMISTSDMVTWSKPKVVLDEEFHLSYPWVFEHDRQWYMMPETSAVHEVRLYRAVNNLLDRFEFAKTILTHGADDEFPLMDFCDSSIVNKDGGFFLFTTLNLGKGNELHLYFSESLDGEYKRHPLSPLIVSDKYGRNGGSLLEHGSSLYRFAQDCDGEYGYNVHLFKVNALTRDEYKESVSQEDVLTRQGLSAGHQYNFVEFRGKYVVTVDQKRWVPFLTCKVKRLFQLLKK